MAERDFPIDFSTLEPDTRPRRWLVLPPGFQAKAAPDQDSPVFDASPEALLAAFKDTALNASRTTLTREGGGQIEVVQKSAVFGFPDHVTAGVAAVEGGAALCIYSRAAVGRYDFNVNKKRVQAWLDETRDRLA
ncbi:MAG: DUF1499 domain-containing protein [Oceanicaulis sp.]